MNIIVEFDKRLVSLADPNSGSGAELRTRLGDRIGRWLEELGIPGLPQLDFRVGNLHQGPAFIDLAVLVGGKRCPFNRGRLLQIHDAISGSAARPTLVTVSHVRDWLQAALNTNGVQVKAEDTASALDFLDQLIFDTVASSVDRLIDDATAMVFLDKLREANPGLESQFRNINATLVTATLQQLVSFPVALHDLETIGDWLVHGRQADWSPIGIAERLFDILRPGVIDIHLHPNALRGMLRDETRDAPAPGQRFLMHELAPAFGEVVNNMCDGLFYELGLYLRHIGCVADPALSETCFRFRLNSQLTTPWLGLGQSELLVSDTKERLTLLNISGTARRNPATGEEYAIISSAAAETAKAAGLTTWTQFAFLTLSLATEVRRAAARLLSVDDVERNLATLHEPWPMQVEAIRAKMNPLDLTRVLRHLLRQRIGIRDLRSILQLLLDFRYTTGFRSPTEGWGGLEPYVYIGDADLHYEPYFTQADPYQARFDLSPLQLGMEPPASWLEGGRIHAEFVKCGLRNYVTHQISRGQNTIIVYLLDANFELELRERLSKGRDLSESPILSQERTTDLLEAIAKKIGDLPDSSSIHVVLIAGTPDVALAFQDMICGDFPELRVVHLQMISPDANIQPIGKISPPEPSFSVSK